MNNTKTIKKSSLAPTVLISGNGGFVTVHLAQAFLLKKCRVVVLHKVLPEDKKAFAPLLKDAKFALFDADINEHLPPQLESVDYAVHFSDIFPTREGVLDLDSIVLSTLGSKNILDLTRSSNAKFCLVAPAFITEHSEQEHKISEKELDKFTSSLVWEYQNKWLIDVRVVRVPTIYGPGLDPNLCASLGPLLTDLISGKELTVYNDGAQKEQYLYVSDAVSAILKALLSSKTSGKEFSCVESLPHTVLETAYIVRSLADGKIGFNVLGDGQGSEKTTLVKTFEGEPIPVFGWELKVGFKDGIVKTLKSLGYKPNLKAFKVGSLIDQKDLEKTALASVSVAKPSQQPQQLSSLVSTPENLSKLGQSSINTGLRRKISSLYNLLYKNLATGKKTAGDRFVTSELVQKIRARKSFVFSKFRLVIGIAVVIGVFGTILVGVPLVISAKRSMAAFDSLQGFKVAVLSLNIEAAGTLSNSAYGDISKAKKAYAKVGWLYKLTGNENAYYSTYSFMQSATYFSRALHSMSLGIEPSTKIWQAIKPDSKLALEKNDFENSQNYLSLAKQDVNLALAEAKNVDSELLPDRVRTKFALYYNSLQNLQRDLNLISQTVLDMPSIFGLDEEKNYLVLFQNQNELRPTGGFIGSYATIKVKNSKILQIEIDDIYNPDGQLSLQTTQPEPLSPIATYLKEDRNYIRNANWNPEFLQSTFEIKKLFNQANGSRYDGVIAMDLDVVKKLLDVLGPIYIPAYNEQISSANLYERTQFHSDFNYKEGESSKKAFLTVLGGKILERLFTLDENKLPNVFTAFSQSLTEKHLLLDFSGTYLSKYFQERNWDGGLLATSGDYLYIVDANIGGTKANYFVDQEVSYGVTSKTRDGLLRGDLELAYVHTGKDNVWPGGPYTDYVRVLTQKGTKLTGAWMYIDEYGIAPQKTNQEDTLGAEQVKGASAGIDIMDKITISNVGSYVSFETPFTLNPQGKLRIVLQYDLPENLSVTKSSHNYSLYWQKQPGAENYKSKFLFSAPFGMTFTQTSPESTVVEGIYDKLFTLDSDAVFKLSLK